MSRIGVFLEMIKFSHTLFALPFAAAAVCLAAHRDGGLRLLDAVGVLLCMVFARTAAMAANRWADRDVDALNPRTAERAIPAGRLSAGFVLTSGLISAALFVASTGLFWLSSRNLYPLALSGPVLLFLAGYSYCKRWTMFSHFWLGAALGFAPIAAWLALRGQLEAPPVLLGAAVLFWVAGFDVLYACQDEAVDRTLGLHSIPAKLGFRGAATVARLAHLGMFLCLVAFGWWTPELGPAFWTVLAVAAALLIWEHRLVRADDLSRVNIAFFNVNIVVSLMTAAAVFVDVLRLHF
ncbi:MAG: UbiA-like polyprenyltransferase [Planctomycetia bacterium]